MAPERCLWDYGEGIAEEGDDTSVLYTYVFCGHRLYLGLERKSVIPVISIVY